jgi:hypothetical protein
MQSIKSVDILETVRQIFQNISPNLLQSDQICRYKILKFMESNQRDVIEQQSYIKNQIDYLIKLTPHNPKVRIFRELTHRDKKVQISVQLYRTIDTNFKIDTFEACFVGSDLQETFRALPMAINKTNILTIPKSGSKHSRWYDMNKNHAIINRISLELRMLQIYISRSNTKIQERLMVDESVILSGVLDLDIKVNYTKLDQYKEISKTSYVEGYTKELHTPELHTPELHTPELHTPELHTIVNRFYKNRGNPVMISPGVYIYNKNGTPYHIISDAILSVKIVPIFSKHIVLEPSFTLDQLKQFEMDLNEFKNSHCCVAIMSVNRHTMFWVRLNDIWYLCDPWKQIYSPGSIYCENTRKIFDLVFGYNHIFKSRDYKEQYKSEGSCAIAALSRVLQIGIDLVIDKSFSIASLTKPIEPVYAMLASSMIRSAILDKNNH